MERIRKLSASYPIFKQLENLTGNQIKQEYCFVAVAGLIFAALFSKGLASPLTNAFALLLIAPQATSIIVSKIPFDVSKTKHTLGYLLTFALCVSLDSMVPFLHRHLPFYYHIKFLFFYYLSIRSYQLTEHLNASLYVPTHAVLMKLMKADPAQALKSAQGAALEKAKETIETVKEAASSTMPSKEE
ncbi:receptor expression-enhancing protein 5/6 [Nematocida sp. LUAm3]|nr:receptor expression-enhancing protein 5/6 [Nematocida sp. LUAm3]KAI5175477.1 receptor expression-enhancing protein 5/6 [Nematocida sp. LUAm2]KAI5178493.1 receptor expression-enhancing protein 5/6 [Nematocida sp. LUAm1]